MLTTVEQFIQPKRGLKPKRLASRLKCIWLAGGLQYGLTA